LGSKAKASKGNDNWNRLILVCSRGCDDDEDDTFVDEFERDQTRSSADHIYRVVNGIFGWRNGMGNGHGQRDLRCLRGFGFITKAR
jgi:hypothetical protein